MIEFVLDSGRSLQVDAYHYARTYAGLVDGLPNARLNRRLTEQAEAEARKLWGRRKVYVLPPEFDRSEPDHPRLPEHQYTVWLICHEPIDSGNDASELVVVFYADDPEDTPFPQLLHRHLRRLSWEHLARDFNW